MITEYTDSAELMRLIADQKIKPLAVKRYLSKQGIIFTATNSTALAADVYTILLGGADIENMTRLIVSEGNYEKSTLINAKAKDTANEDLDVIDYFADGFNRFRTSPYAGYIIDQPVKTENDLTVRLVYKRKLPGKNRLLSEEERHIKIVVRKYDDKKVSIDIRHTSSFDAQKAIDLLQQIANAADDADMNLSHVNLDLLSAKNKVAFFDRLAATDFGDWRLSTITGITVKKGSLSGDEDEVTELTEDGDTTGALAGINQAVLNGQGLRSNSFVQGSLDQGYVITAMKYRYDRIQEASEFVINISSKGLDLRVDIDKSYYDEDGKLCVQPFPKPEQDVIIQKFQQAANSVFYSLLDEQSRSA